MSSTVELPSFTDEKPTMALRFVERDDGDNSSFPRRILQQCWLVVKSDGIHTTSHHEWRDVPLEVE